MHTLKFLEDARLEFQEAAEWYESRSEGLGERFRDSINRKIEAIKKSPERYPKKKNDFRGGYFENFPIHHCLHVL
jgi:hypothetical protein